MVVFPSSFRLQKTVSLFPIEVASRNMNAVPKGPLMCTVEVCCVWVAPFRFLLLRSGGRTSNVTPEGMERGALPIFEGRLGDEVKVLREESEGC